MDDKKLAWWEQDMLPVIDDQGDFDAFISSTDKPNKIFHRAAQHAPGSSPQLDIRAKTSFLMPNEARMMKVMNSAVL